MATRSVQLPATIPARGDQLPGFTSETSAGEAIRLRDFYMRRNLALLFTHGPDCSACRDLLAGLAERRVALQAEDGEALAVIPGDPAQVRALVAALELPFPVILDPQGDIHRRYGLVDSSGEPLAAIFLADRFGTVYESSVADADHQIMPAEEVPGWLEFIACRCR